MWSRNNLLIVVLVLAFSPGAWAQTPTISSFAAPLSLSNGGTAGTSGNTTMNAQLENARAIANAFQTQTIFGPKPDLSASAAGAAENARVLSVLTQTQATVLPQPQGRLTLSSNTPVMTADVTAVGTIYYDCYAGNTIPWYNGRAYFAAPIPSCQFTLTLESSSTGVENSAGVFDIFYSGAGKTICVPTNNSGGGWASDGGSNTARGTGYSALDQTGQPFIANNAAVSFCFNGTTNECATACAKDTLTYLGTFYTTAAGQTGVAIALAAASGGSNPVMGLWNAYNRVQVTGRVQDNKAAWHANAASTWETLDQGASNNFNNRITWIDGLAQSPSICTTQVYVVNGSSNESPSVGCNLNSTSASPISFASAGTPVSGTETLTSVVNFYPTVGLNYGQMMEFCASTSLGTFGNANGAVAEGFVTLQM